MRKTAILVLVIAALLAVQVSTVSLTITCYQCGASTCNSGYCFGLKGSDGYSQVACAAVGTTCDTTMNTTVQILNCTVDYKSDNCTTKACFSVADKQLAYFMDKPCDTGFYSNYTCGTCASTNCYSQSPNNLCQNVATSLLNGTNSNNTGATCVSTSCAKPSVNIKVQNCVNGRDVMGTYKKCCMTMLGSASYVCSTESTVLGSTKFQKWATGTGNFEKYLTTMIISALMLCLGLFIA